MQTICDVFKNAFGEWIRPLKDHADAASHSTDILIQNIFSVKFYLAFQPRSSYGFVQAIQGADES